MHNTSAGVDGRSLKHALRPLRVETKKYMGKTPRGKGASDCNTSLANLLVQHLLVSFYLARRPRSRPNPITLLPTLRARDRQKRSRGPAACFSVAFLQKQSAGRKASLDRFNQIVVLHEYFCKKAVLRLGASPAEPATAAKDARVSTIRTKILLLTVLSQKATCSAPARQGKSNTTPKTTAVRAVAPDRSKGSNQQQRFVCRGLAPIAVPVVMRHCTLKQRRNTPC